MQSFVKLLVRQSGSKEKCGEDRHRMAATNTPRSTTFPPPGYQPTPINTLLANALDLSAPASDALVKNRKNAWIQLAGHPGFFAPAGLTTIWKRQPENDNCETKSYRQLMSDSVRDIVPRFYREVRYNDDIFIELEDLLQHFTDPNIMDIKMGIRTFLEGEVKNPTRRNDLYQKMIKIDPSEPTEDENKEKAVTKLRYMQFREKGSSTTTLGFRIEAIRMSGETPNADLKQVQSREEVMNTIIRFTGHDLVVCRRLLARLKDIRFRFEASKFFRNHEIIGSSLLVLYDRDQQANIWMIDFAKTLKVSDVLTHRAAWKAGNHEDGYLTGLDNLVQIFTELTDFTRRRESDGTILIGQKRRTSSQERHLTNPD